MKKHMFNRTRTNLLTVEGVRFFPGNNTITEEELERCKRHPSWPGLTAGHNPSLREIVAKRAIPKVVDPMDMSEDDKGSETTCDITEMTIKDAVPIIEETLNLRDLQMMKDAEIMAENRKGIISAIDDKIDDLTNIPDENRESAKKNKGDEGEDEE